MLHALENGTVKITVAEHGAELKSLTGLADGTEYLFDSNPTWWKYSAPILFPIVGKVKGGKYRAEGKEFSLPAHGFGRVSDFWLVDASTDSITFALESNANTLAVYPYRFRLEVSYKLVGNEVQYIWRVTNTDSREIYFSIGAHPAFRCPIVDGEKFTDCYLKFNRPEKSARLLLADNGLSHERVPTLDGTEFDLNYEIFRGDALIFDDLKSDEVSICSRKSSKSLTVRAKGFKYWGIWTPVKGGAPFLCIEPWHGLPDFVDFTGELKDKAGIQKLGVGQVFDTQMSFIIS